jgi:hypothetical protein
VKKTHKMATSSIANGHTESRVKRGKCIVKGCKDEELLDCIRCNRHDICFNHMAGSGFTRVFCKDCIDIVAHEEYLVKMSIEKDNGTKRKSKYDE